MVVQRLQAELPPGVRVAECRGDVLASIDQWRGFSAVVAVDAAAPNGQPGRIYRFDLASEPLPVGFAPCSTHALSLADAIELARGLGRLPRQFVAYVIEGERFDVGATLSPAVAASVNLVADRVVVELARMLRASAKDGGRDA